MKAIPKPALWLGLAGLIPFIYGALTHLEPRAAFTPLFGVALINFYGVIILCFMAGVLWGFAASAQRTDWPLYVASVAPALLAFVPALFMPTMYQGQGGVLLLFNGFVILLILDNWFATQQLAPDWWMSLRTLLTAIVWACLAVGGFA